MPDEPNWTQRLLDETFLETVESHEELPSTNDRALHLLQNNTPPLPALILAERQTRGRGRADNHWWSTEGALTFSLMVASSMEPLTAGSQPSSLPPPDNRPVADPRLALAAGIAVADTTRQTLHSIIPPQHIGLKWPNDVMAGGRKLCGILTEVSPRSREAVVGMGINVNNTFEHAPEDVRQRATSLKQEAGRALSRFELLKEILRNFHRNMHRLTESADWLTETWATFCILTNRPVELHIGSEIHGGICRGIQPDGALLLESQQKLRPVYAATTIRSTPPS